MSLDSSKAIMLLTRSLSAATSRVRVEQTKKRKMREKVENLVEQTKMRKAISKVENLVVRNRL